MNAPAINQAGGGVRVEAVGFISAQLIGLEHLRLVGTRAVTQGGGLGSS